MQEHRRLLETMSSHNGLPAMPLRVAAGSGPLGGILAYHFCEAGPAKLSAARPACQMSCSLSLPCPVLSHTAWRAQGVLGASGPTAAVLSGTLAGCPALLTPPVSRLPKLQYFL